MNNCEFTGIIAFVSILAGLIGSLTGLGGGIVTVPLLVLGFGIDIHYAAGASLIAVIATSSGAASAFVKQGFTNVRLGMLMEIATTVGAILGSNLASRLNGSIISIAFGCTLLYSAYAASKQHLEQKGSGKEDLLAKNLKLNNTYPTESGKASYGVHKVPAGFGVMLLGGSLSGLLGIGSGSVKVLAMDQIMGMPFKVSTTTSNFMIGVTAAASVGTYFKHGYIQPLVAAPVMLGVLIGSLIGAKLLARLKTKTLRLLFAIVIALTGVQMLYKGLLGGN